MRIFIKAAEEATGPASQGETTLRPHFLLCSSGSVRIALIPALALSLCTSQ